MFGTGELILIFGAILLLFGGKRLPGLAKSLGEGIREFKKACNSEPERVSVQEEIPQDKCNTKTQKHEDTKISGL